MNISGIGAFAKSLTGEVVLPHDRRYGKLRRVSNRAVNMHPAIIVRCANSEDVRLQLNLPVTKACSRQCDRVVTVSRVMASAMTDSLWTYR